MERLEDLKKELETKRQDLLVELESARGKIPAIEADLRRVDEALGALTKKKGPRRSRPRKSSLTLTELRRHLLSVRGELPFTQGKELERVVRARVRQSGGSLAGFEPLYTEALASMNPFADPRSGPRVPGPAQDSSVRPS